MGSKRSLEATDPIFALIAEHRSADGELAKAVTAADLRDHETLRARELETARDKAWEIERDCMWRLISTAPTTIEGLAALLGYSRERGSMSALIRPEWQHAFEWTIECAVCALAGLPRPPKTEIVAEVWDEQTDHA
jgi:hypothetical protein